MGLTGPPDKGIDSPPGSEGKTSGVGGRPNLRRREPPGFFQAQHFETRKKKMKQKKKGHGHGALPSSLGTKSCRPVEITRTPGTAGKKRTEGKKILQKKSIDAGGAQECDPQGHQGAYRGKRLAACSEGLKKFPR